MEDDVLLHLPMDINYKILSHVSDPASLVRLASSCEFWRNLIKDSAFLDRLKEQRHSHGFTPSLLLGFVYQDSTKSPLHLRHHQRDKQRCSAPRFMPISELSQFIGSKADHNAVEPTSLGTFSRGLGVELNFYEPIASHDGFLALRHRQVDGQSQGDELCVCNPLTGEIFHIPSLPIAAPDRYALLVTEDISHDGHTSQSFQLVAIWIRERRFINGTYCSKTRGWNLHGSAPELLSPGFYVMSSPPTVSPGAVHFLCGCWKNWTLTHVTTLHVDTPEMSYLELPPDAKRDEEPLLASSADGELLLLHLKGLQMTLWKHDSSTRFWILSGRIDIAGSLPLRAVQMQARANVRLELFGGKSGAVVLSVEGEGRFLFSLSDGSMRKIDNERVTKKYCLCPYEIDWLSILVIMNLVVDGSLSRDGGRKMVQGRWRTLMEGHMIAKQSASGKA